MSQSGFSLRAAYWARTGDVLDYVALMKPRVVAVVAFTGLVGLYLAPGRVGVLESALAVLCIALGAGAAGAFNMWYERDIDRVMQRTQGRPLPAGRVRPDDALFLAVVAAIGSVILLGVALNWLSAGLLASAILLYTVIYTVWLKPRTPQNIVVGGAAGALAPVIGWSAATGHVGLPALALAALIFLWTPPHFWALALCRVDDYAAAGVPMLPVVAGSAETRRQILIYSLVLWPAALAPSLLGLAGVAFGIAALLLSMAFTALCLRLYLRPARRIAMQTFSFSILYIVALFALAMLGAAR
jgi:protoheme IX farnesyltransferase